MRPAIAVSARAKRRNPPPLRPPRKKRGAGETVAPPSPPLPPPLASVLYSPRHDRLVFMEASARFLYQARADEWRRVYGLTSMLRHCFWPDYDRADPAIEAASGALRRRRQQAERARARRQRSQFRGRKSFASGWTGLGGGGKFTSKSKTQRKMKSKGGRGAPGGAYTGAEVRRMLRAPRGDAERGMELGNLVHGELARWAMDRFYGTDAFFGASAVRPREHTLALIRAISEQLRIDVRYSELQVCDPGVPVATAIDLIGWHHATRSVVVVEVKTGSADNMALGNAEMRGRVAREMRLVNSPLNQARAQLAVTRAIVEALYVRPHGARVRGALVWANKVDGVRYEWLSPQWEFAGHMLLDELRVHMRERGGRAWATPQA